MTLPVILHISDIHRTKEEPVNNDQILLPLLGEFDRYAAESLPIPNVVVLSGDITQSAQPAEYEEAGEFIQKLLGRLSLGVDRLIVVPGNHDVDWNQCYRDFQFRPAPPAEIPRELCCEIAGKFLCPASEDAFENRLDNFRKFYKDLYRVEYARDRKNHFRIHRLDDLGIAFAGFSSCETNSHENRRGKINITAISQAVTALADFSGISIAVWHHDMNWRGDTCSDTLDIHSLRYLSERRFNYGFCGHTHRPAANDVVHMGGIRLPVIAAGSLCAGPRERPESVPRSYNLIEVHPDGLRVYVREKPDVSSPWTACPVQTETLEWKNSYWVDHTARPTPIEEVASGPNKYSQVAILTPTEAKIPTPFAEINAKAATRHEVVRQFVWTDAAFSLDCNMPQIIVGPRGAGKTALLLSLTFEGRVASPRSKTPDDVMQRIGLMCSMNVGETTAFNGKGWLDPDERSSVFNATIGTIWAQELVHTIEKSLAWAASREQPAPSEAQVAKLLSEMMAVETELTELSSISRWIKNLRSRLILATGIRNDEKREAALGELMRHPVTRGTPGFLADLASELSRYPLFKRSRWILLFDEVEYLSDWQQEAIYGFLAESSQHVISKVATLPYAHARVMQTTDHRVLTGNDFSAVVLSLTADLELQPSEDQASQKFEDLAAKLWRNRLEAAGIAPRALSEVWPDEQYESVVSNVTAHLVKREDLESALIAQITPESQTRALELRASNLAAFRDQYWRKFAQPFRVRYAHALEQQGLDMPLTWGWRALLRACDGNCRWFLRLADDCWSNVWARNDMRAMTPTEQYAALRRWAGQIYRVVGSMTREGPVLKEVIDRAAADLRARLVGHPYLVPEALTFQVRDLSQGQADAIAVGVALGYFVPRAEEGEQTIYYPTKDVELRLGFPLAIEKRLPLRSGAILKIGDLKQVAFQWLKEEVR